MSVRMLYRIDPAGPELELSTVMIIQNERLFLELLGEKDGEEVRILIPLHEAAKRLFRGFDPDYSPGVDPEL